MAEHDSNHDNHDHKIHLVLNPVAHGDPAGTKNRLEMGDYIADILVDRRGYPVVVHWIVQRVGSADILQWGHEDTHEAAVREATAWMESLIRYDDFRRSRNP